jgi:hypothetical protein
MGPLIEGDGEMSDMSSRLEWIEERTKELMRSDSVDKTPAIVELTYLVGYLAKLLKKHLESGEK